MLLFNVFTSSAQGMAETSSDYGLPPSAGGWNQQNCADPDWNRQFCNCIASCAQGEYACEVRCCGFVFFFIFLFSLGGLQR